MRIFFVRFSYVEILFVVGGLIVMIVYVMRMFRFITLSPDRGSGINLLVGFYYSSIVFYLLSMVLVPFLPGMAEPAGGIGFALLLGFLGLSFLRKTILVNGNKIVPIRYVGAFKDRSVLLLSLFLMFTFYMGFTKIGVIPKMYSDAYPQQYFNLVNQAETGQNEEDNNRKVLHEEFKEEYDRFIERHRSTEN
ncbi:MAG: hypothetical protein HC811_10830 [Flammeovirgaceae bacterium]|nr:hypothetical protein [Flammeovirgaceae bacterium]